MSHIIAKISLLNNVEHPKENGVKSGYAPHHKFPDINYLVSGFHTYDNNDIHYPGETFDAIIKFPSWEYIKNYIKVGDIFELMEAERIVGSGIVSDIF